MHNVVKDYRNNVALRKSFNELAGKTFGINFEDWYQNGFWTDKYNPYSIVIDEKIVANVSVNQTDMCFDGKVKHFIQLGTVMTDEAYRNQGLIREIMEQIDADYQGKVDGMYLFSNDSVVTFYPKFGFQKGVEYQYTKQITNKGKNQFEKIVMDNATAWRQLENVMEQSVFHGRFDMINNKELNMFYVTKYLQESVYYHKDTDTYVIADVENDKIFIQNVFSGKLTELDDILMLFGEDIREVTLGFTPIDTESYQMTELHEEDCTFFVKGKELEIMEREKLRIPALSHA